MDRAMLLWAPWGCTLLPRPPADARRSVVATLSYRIVTTLSYRADIASE